MIELSGAVPITVYVDETTRTVQRVIVWLELLSSLSSAEMEGSEAERTALEITDTTPWPVWEFGA